MKALALDTTVSCITIAARNQEKTATLSLDVGMHQSERLLPAITLVLKECNLEAKDLDFVAISKGPGSFTGLRLGFSAAKALNLATNCPIYAISSLEIYAKPYDSWNGCVISAIDAKKDRFFAAMYKNGQEIIAATDATPEQIGTWLPDQESVLLVGPDGLKLKEKIEKLAFKTKVYCFDAHKTLPTDVIFIMAEKLCKEGKPALQPYEGPVYLRKSEAEEKAN
ncbi:MAG: tRNA (adenosine(37)-N6)-threonylcarbamoyltransferase complex dimerization subunit type 1 TsaB [Spirochaetaceae bacterium]|nr:tRNA (adenosine(37)-N6)-threonylcarbamoyltransferase complex dimerization subunit type 1 TsaB [Spirochaetaceae bacterium]